MKSNFLFVKKIFFIIFFSFLFFDNLDATEVKPGPTKDIKLASPDVTKFDDDLQQLIHKLTKGDAIVYQRVLELYEEQRYWGL